MIQRLTTMLLCTMIIALAPSCKSKKKLVKRQSRAEHLSVGVTQNRAIQTKYAALLNVPEAEIRNVRLYQFVDDWTGTSYQYGGTSKAGVDCSGFIGALYSDVYQKTIPRTTSEIERKSSPVSKSSLNEGDVVIFDISGKKNSHVGVYLLNGHFVHASSSKGVIISDLDNPYYQKAFNRGGRF